MHDLWTLDRWLEPRADVVLAELRQLERRWATHFLLPVGLVISILGVLLASLSAVVGVAMVVAGIRWLQSGSRRG